MSLPILHGRRRTRLLVLVTVLALFATGCSLLGIGGDSYTVTAEFSRTYNLFPGSPVRVMGVQVGKVTDMRTSPDSTTVAVDMTVRGDTTLPADARAVVIPAALLGERYVQLYPPMTGDGPALKPGSTIPVDRTTVPAEFDEVLNSLNNFVGNLDPKQVSRLVSNAANVLDGKGKSLGQVIDNAHRAIQTLSDNDTQLVSLASRLSDLNEVLASRDQKIGNLIEDWNTVAASLANNRDALDASLKGLARLSDQLASLLQDHRQPLQQDIATLTRIGQTANRNVDQISELILGSAELFRGADRVIDREHNWLPLVNHAGPLSGAIADSVANRLVGVCLRLGVGEDACNRITQEGMIPKDVCLPPLVPCPDGGGTSAGDAIRDAVKKIPELGDAIRNQGGTGGSSGGDGGLGGLTGDVGGALTGQGGG